MAGAESFDCDNNHCNLYSREAYPHFVVGTVRAAATKEQAEQVFRFASQNGYWANLPDDSVRFAELVQIMSVAIPEGDSEVEMSLMLSREEFNSSPLRPGDLVRYTPHRTDEPMTPLFRQSDKKPYWDLFGCVAVLCSKEDAACPGEYSTGVYRFTDGVQLDRLTQQPVEAGARIDTGTMRPITNSLESKE